MLERQTPPPHASSLGGDSLLDLLKGLGKWRPPESWRASKPEWPTEWHGVLFWDRLGGGGRGKVPDKGH